MRAGISALLIDVPLSVGILVPIHDDDTVTNGAPGDELPIGYHWVLRSCGSMGEDAMGRSGELTEICDAKEEI